jgi:hypothetical protein
MIGRTVGTRSAALPVRLDTGHVGAVLSAFESRAGRPVNR